LKMRGFENEGEVESLSGKFKVKSRKGKVER
jgi:hypothetical protein